MNDSIIVHKKSSASWFYFIDSLLFTALSIYFTFCFPIELTGGKQLLINILKPVFFFGIFFFGGCTFFCIKRLFNPKPILQVDESGITDTSSALAIGHIPWRDISDVQLTHYFNQTFISVAVKDEKQYLSKMNFLQKQATKTNMKMGFPLVNITLNTSGVDPEAIFLQIKERYRDRYDPQLCESNNVT
ncbi:STM3941 family protein [Streptococcus dentiloxodontae]